MERYVKLISNNRSHKKLSPIGLCLHETATPGATALNEYNYFNNNSNIGASAHGFIDWNMYIQTIPYNEIAWHAGPTANGKYIGIEMCRPKSYNKDQFNKVWNNTVLIFAELCIEYGFDPYENITTHHECTSKWHETDHTDPTQLFNEYGTNINKFKSAVAEKISELEGELTMSQYEDLMNIIEKQAERISALERKTTPMIYDYIDDNSAKIAEDANDALLAAMNKGVLKGTGDGKLGLTYDMIRIHIWNYRMGLYN